MRRSFAWMLLAGAALFAALFAAPSRATLVSDLEAAVQGAVAFVQDEYIAFGASGESPGTCTYYDACNDPMVSSSTRAVAPNWLAGGTPYHDLCGGGGDADSDGVTVTETVAVVPGSNATTTRTVGTVFPETPDCAPVLSTSCAVNVTYDVPAMKLLTGTPMDAPETAEALCVLRDLDLHAKATFADLLDTATYPEYVYGTVGDTGILQTWPGVEWGSCPSDYDPRFRPWYTSAVMGPKNVVLILDYSLSMNNYGRRSLMEEAAAKVLGTLNDNDYVGLVTFAAAGDTYSSTLQPYTANLACQLETYWLGLRTAYATNYQAAFDAAFDMLEASKAAGTVSACDTTVFLFLSDGEVYGGGYEGQELKDHIAGRNAAHDVRILTYVLGGDTDASLANAISCDNNGLGFQIDDSGPLADAMAAYFRLFTAQMVPGTLPATWTRYRDFNSGNWVATVCQSAWDAPGYEQAGLSQVFGVVCSDVTEAHILAADGGLGALELGLGAAASSCPVFDFDRDAAAMDLLRLTMPGGPVQCTVPWWHWGIPVSILGFVVILLLLAVYGPKMHVACEKRRAEAREARLAQDQRLAHSRRQNQLPVEMELPTVRYAVPVRNPNVPHGSPQGKYAK